MSKRLTGLILAIVGAFGELGIIYMVQQTISANATISAAKIAAADFNYWGSVINTNVWSLIQENGYMNFVFLFGGLILVGLYMCLASNEG